MGSILLTLATAASYLLFTKPFTDELISLGYRDTMWDHEAMENFLGTV
jgi:NTE family protein